MATADFTLFPELPSEVRRAVWRAALPRRLVPLALPQAIGYDDSGDEAPRQRRRRRRLVPPVVARACREARSVAFEHGRLWFDGGAPGEDQVWFDPSVDTVFVNSYMQLLHRHGEAGHAGLMDGNHLFAAAEGAGVVAVALSQLLALHDPTVAVRSPSYVVGSSYWQWLERWEASLLAGRRPRIWVLKTLSLKLTDDQARASGLFGDYGDELAAIYDGPVGGDHSDLLTRALAAVSIRDSSGARGARDDDIGGASALAFMQDRNVERTLLDFDPTYIEQQWLNYCNDPLEPCIPGQSAGVSDLYLSSRLNYQHPLVRAVLDEMPKHRFAYAFVRR